MSEYVWQCSYCGREQDISEDARQLSFADLTLPNAEGPRRLVVKYVVCPDPACRRFTLTASLHGLSVTAGRSYTGKHLATWNLVPPSRARNFPVPLPKEVLEDYREACLLDDLSPKAAAALARRCLSGMLRDFWRVQPGRLGDEFRQVKALADPLTWEAIESVRRCGSIGARMDSEGAEVQDTEPGEAKLLIGLIETLVQDWYVAREERRKRLVGLRQIAGAPATQPPARDSENEEADL